jgi:hypothetical protein
MTRRNPSTPEQPAPPPGNSPVEEGQPLAQIPSQNQAGNPFESHVDGTTLIQIVYGMATQTATPEILAEYIGRPLSDLMRDAVDAPADAVLNIDGVEQPPTYILPEGFTARRIQAVQKSGEKG